MVFFSFVGLFFWVWLSQMWPVCVAQASLELSVWARLTLNLKESKLRPLPANAGIIGIQLTLLFCELSPYFLGSHGP